MINNKKLEDGVISTLIVDDSTLNEYLNDLNPNLFHSYSNVIIIKAILELKNKSIHPDHDALENYFKKIDENIDIYQYIEPLSVHNFSSYIIELKELAYKRELKKLCLKLISKSDSKDSDVFEIDAEIQSTSSKLSNIITTNEVEDNVTLMRNVINEIEAAKNNNGVTGALTGFRDVDALTGGWQKSDLIILAARPAMGKTALSIKKAMNGAIEHNQNILFFSLEMSATQLMKREFSSISDIPLEKFKNNDEIDYSHLNHSIQPLEGSFRIFDKCFSLYDIKAQCRRENSIRKLDVIYIDYLQLIKHKVGDGRSKENEVSEISRDLKLLAKELDVPIIALSQLSRAVEQRGGDKIPVLSDLRDSGSIEQDADIVAFLYRPEYYKIYEDEEGNSTQGVAMLIFAKHRNGRTDSIKMKFEGDRVKFSDWNNSYEQVRELGGGIIQPNRMEWLD